MVRAVLHPLASTNTNLRYRVVKCGSADKGWWKASMAGLKRKTGKERASVDIFVSYCPMIAVVTLFLC